MQFVRIIFYDTVINYFRLFREYKKGIVKTIPLKFTCKLHLLIISIYGYFTKFFLNTQQLVVFCHTV